MSIISMVVGCGGWSIKTEYARQTFSSSMNLQTIIDLNC